MVLNTPKDLAKDLIRTYVLRGDTIESLKAGQQGSYGGGYGVQIGGYGKEKRYSTDKILVIKFANKEVEIAFSLKELYNEILTERVGKQLNLI